MLLPAGVFKNNRLKAEKSKALAPLFPPMDKHYTAALPPQCLISIHKETIATKNVTKLLKDSLTLKRNEGKK